MDRTLCIGNEVAKGVERANNLIRKEDRKAIAEEHTRAGHNGPLDRCSKCRGELQRINRR